MERPVRYFLKCKCNNSNGKEVTISKIMMVNPKMNENDLKDCIQSWENIYQKQGFKNFSIITY